jgi:hypothetical protein
MSVILATWKAEIGRMVVQSQTRQTVCKTSSPKNNQSRMDWGCGSSGRVPALLKCQSYHKKKKRKKERKKLKYLQPTIKYKRIYIKLKFTYTMFW